MKTCETRVRIITKSMRLFALVATCLLTHGAWAAVWTGGAGGDLATAANWDGGDIATTAMAFTNDVTLTLSSNTAVYDVFWNTVSLADNRQKNRNVAFNLNGHTLANLTKGDWFGEGATFTFSGGTFLNVAADGTTNEITLVNSNRSHSQKLVATGADTVFVSSLYNRVRRSDYPDISFRVLDHAKAYGDHYSLGGHGSTNEVSGGASLTFDTTFTLGSVEAAYTGHHDNKFLLSGGTLAARDPTTAGTLYVANGGAVRDNLFLAENGATVTVYAVSVGLDKATNNTMRLTGRGTRLTQVPSAGPTSWIGKGSGSVSNRLVVADGAVAEFNRVLCVGTGGSVGGTLRIENGGAVTNNSSVYIGHNTRAQEGKSAHVVVTGEGSEWSSPSSWLYLINGTGNAEDAHEISVSDGAKFNGKLAMAGVGNRLVVSNATASLSNLMTTNTTEGVTGASGSTIRIAGANAKLTTNALNGNDNGFAGSEVIEFVIPETGWAEAPFQANVAFTIREGVTLKLDAASVKAFQKANPSGGIAPLMTTGSSSRRITISDATMAELSANLPNGCSLVNESGVLSVRMPKAPGLAIFVR